MSAAEAPLEKQVGLAVFFGSANICFYTHAALGNIFAAGIQEVDVVFFVHVF